jgi:hypothetical protein
MPDDTLHEIRGVEIFRAGTWNGDDYSIEDLDEIVDAFGKVGFTPPIKLGHDEPPGTMAFGWVKSLRRIGDRLIADFMDVPAEVFGLIKRRAFDTVSSEIYWNLKRGAKTFRRALRAVALLGAQIPAVAGLKPLRTVVAEDESTYGSYDMPLNHETGGDDPGAALVALARAFAFEHNIGFGAALARVRGTDEGRTLILAYGAAANGQTIIRHHREADSLPSTAGDKLDRLIRMAMARDPCLSYSAAASRILRENPAISSIWCGGASFRG